MQRTNLGAGVQQVEKAFTHQASTLVERKEQPAVTTATRKVIGPINVPGKQADIPKRSSSSETIKYQFYNLHEQDYEYENSHKDKYPFYVGSLYKNFSFWKEILKANNFVLNVISSGYLIPFYENTSSARFNNNTSAFNHSVFAERAINKLLETGQLLNAKITFLLLSIH
ncbi:unnamed protein product [Mytilus coruscus]|uniref:Uncharacterized protein n=1 Tax=Mytilus coruscus TaxID=42192 RepID=A0A6J8CXH4_MYTCO|nr:unnamed protein product [Mytilus coruscus]